MTIEKLEKLKDIKNIINNIKFIDYETTLTNFSFIIPKLYRDCKNNQYNYLINDNNIDIIFNILKELILSNNDKTSKFLKNKEEDDKDDEEDEDDEDEDDNEEDDNKENNEEDDNEENKPIINKYENYMSTKTDLNKYKLKDDLYEIYKTIEKNKNIIQIAGISLNLYLNNNINKLNDILKGLYENTGIQITFLKIKGDRNYMDPYDYEVGYDSIYNIFCKHVYNDYEYKLSFGEDIDNLYDTSIILDSKSGFEMYQFVSDNIIDRYSEKEAKYTYIYYVKEDVGKINEITSYTSG